MATDIIHQCHAHRVRSGDLTGLEATSSSAMRLASGAAVAGARERACSVFCYGPLLHAVQTAHIFNDSKTFVDMPLKDEPEVVLKAFEDLQDKGKESLREFVNKWFGDPDSTSVEWQPTDWQEQPEEFNKIVNPKAQEWAHALNKLWFKLGRKQIPDVAKNQSRYSLMARDFPMIVPGGRFRETYYWDTYWIVEGLLISGMRETALGMVQNLLDIVDEIGFVPNGGRVYYLDRSQPPFLTAMVRLVFGQTGDKEWLKKAIPILRKEYEFWMKPTGGRVVHFHTAEGEEQTLNVFSSARRSPRPESYREDVETAKSARGRHFEDVYAGLAAGAETGWDYSTRWLSDATGVDPLGTADLTTINANKVVAVDLNSILYDMEKTLAGFCALFRLDLPDMADAHNNFTRRAASRKTAMDTWLWTGDSYRDYRVDVGRHSAVKSLSDWAGPLWAGMHGPGDAHGNTMIASLKRSGILRMCGIPVTVVDSGGKTQWDAPNGWSPIIQMLIEGLDRLPEGSRISNTIADTWLQNNYLGWKHTGKMFEKYDVYSTGSGGGGGEYEPQEGFGWTNGVVLSLLMRNPDWHPFPERHLNH